MKVVLFVILKRIGWFVKGIRRFYRKLSATQKALLFTALIALIVGGILGGVIGRSVGKNKEKKAVAVVKEEIQNEEKQKRDALEKEIYDLKEELNSPVVELPWNLVLVNATHKMEEGYVPELVELEEGCSVDSRIADAARKMLADAKAKGLHVEICSAYRSVKRQEQVFGDSMKERVKAGMSYWEAYEETALNVAAPGTSEHALGLALDLISNQYTELDERQETTAEAKWLEANCYKYGFILRYPPEKTNITGIIYEPWHYRYVGKEHAKKIMELGVTLEEYLQGYYTPEGGNRMMNLTFGEQVKIILGRKGMTIKELAELVEQHTGKPMSRQNMTQRLGRDNFQEQDMRMIADILGCQLTLSLMETPVAVTEDAVEDAMIETVEEITETTRDITVGELVDMEETEEDVNENVSEETIQATVEVTPEESAEKEEERIQAERELLRKGIKGFFKKSASAPEPVKEAASDNEEQTEMVGEINPYTRKEYESNSVRMHPKRIGYVQVYDREQHKWTDMTEWAFLGYQERKKKLLGKDYKPPIYLD